MKYGAKIFLMVFIFCCVFFFVTIGTSLAAGPSITGITPSSGPVATTVTISGNNFASSVSGNTVSFNGTTTSPTSATTIQLIVVVPEGSTSGNVTVKTSEGTSNAVIFSISAPVFDSITPNTAAIGDTVIISGSGFSTTPANNIVTFSDGKTASVINATTTQLSVEVPAEAESGSVAVTVEGLTSSPCAFSVSATGVAPTLSEISILILITVFIITFSKRSILCIKEQI